MGKLIADGVCEKYEIIFFNEGCKQHKLAFDNLSSLFLCNMICLVIGENVT